MAGLDDDYDIAFPTVSGALPGDPQLFEAKYINTDPSDSVLDECRFHLTAVNATTLSDYSGDNYCWLHKYTSSTKARGTLVSCNQSSIPATKFKFDGGKIIVVDAGDGFMSEARFLGLDRAPVSTNAYAVPHDNSDYKVYNTTLRWLGATYSE